MWKTIRDFLSKDHFESSDLQNTQKLKIAIAGLLVEVAGCDDNMDSYERQQLLDILVDHFDLTDDEAQELMHQGCTANKNAVDLHKFVRIINADFDNDRRKDVLRYAWQIVLADGEIDNYEDNLIRKLGSLLGISRQESVFIRNEITETRSRV